MLPRFDAARALLEAAVRARDIPGAVAVAGDRENIYPLAACGVRRYAEKGEEAPEDFKVTPETRYDLASLTKVVATLPAILKLMSVGELSLETKVGELFSNAGWMRTPSLAEASVRQLLAHSSGLPSWKPLFAQTSDRSVALASVLQTELESPGSYVYSDLGFILLGAMVERVSGLREDDFVRQNIFEPLGMHDTCYGPLQSVPVAATENCGWRGKLLQGIVHDENAYALGGVAGHAGLFGAAANLARYAQAWLNLDARLGDPALLEQATQEQLSDGVGTRRGLGWLLKGKDSSVGALASERAYGHTGFTGTSLWLDPEQGWFAVLLTNRIHPSRKCGANMHRIRQQFHEAVARAWA
jgi:CubicO group peptidase (beta-lactamase class C family)